MEISTFQTQKSKDYYLIVMKFNPQSMTLLTFYIVKQTG